MVFNIYHIFGIFDAVIPLIKLIMKKITFILIFFISCVINAQEELPIAQSDLDVCVCSICKTEYKCYEPGECLGRDYEETNLFYKKRKPKGTHVYVTALAIYMDPNPVNDFTVISVGDAENLDIYMVGYLVYDFNGNLISSTTLSPCQSYTADFSALQPGTYIMNIQIDESISGSNIIHNLFVKE